MKPVSVQAYLDGFDGVHRQKLDEMRALIREVLPDADEVIAYQMPSFKLGKIVVYYAAFKNHIGLYPTSSGIARFRDRLGEYRASPGAVQFPLDRPLPKELIQDIVRFRRDEVLG